MHFDECTSRLTNTCSVLRNALISSIIAATCIGDRQASAIDQLKPSLDFQRVPIFAPRDCWLRGSLWWSALQHNVFAGGNARVLRFQTKVILQNCNKNITFKFWLDGKTTRASMEYSYNLNLIELANHVPRYEDVIYVNKQSDAHLCKILWRGVRGTTPRRAIPRWCSAEAKLCSR